LLNNSAVVRSSQRNFEVYRRLEPLEELERTLPCPRVEGELHLADLFVYVLHEVYHEVHEFVFVHLLGVKIGDEERDLVALDRLAPQDYEIVRPHH